ncbi:phosphatase PAP2 family protein [Corynebacteriaceae bacterium 7-707]
MNTNSIPLATSSPRTSAPKPALRTGWAIVLTIILALGAALSYTVRQDLYTSAVRWAGHSGLEGSIDLIASKGLLALVALTAGVALWTLFRSRRRFWTLVSSGAGVGAAYALSEGIKILVAEPRPCSGSDLATVIACPAAGDWSWPSNHAVLAAAFATACVIALVRTCWVAVPLAVAIAVSRVLAGVHYPHDVLSGLVLGMLVVTGAVIALRPLLDRVTGIATGAGASMGGRA